MAYADTPATQLTSLVAMDLTQTKRDLLLSLRGNITTQAASLVNITDEQATLFNDLDSRLNILANASQTDLSAVTATLTAITNLQSEGDFANTFVGAFSALYEALNTRNVNISFERVVAGTDGLLDVDVSSYNFPTKGSYNVQVSFVGTTACVVSYEKVSKDLFKVIVRDSEYFEFDEAGFNGRDCSVDNLIVGISITALPEAMSTSFTEVDGDVTTIPNGGTTAPADVDAPDAPVITTTDVTTEGQLTVQGTGEVGATVTVTFPTGNPASMVVPASGGWSITQGVYLDGGNVSATLTDEAGNVSISASAAFAEAVVDEIDPNANAL